jgi:hypothetical protein
MTHAILRATIEAAVDAVDFQGPTVAFCEDVFRELRTRLPSAILDVYFRGSEFRAEARIQGVSHTLAITC